MKAEPIQDVLLVEPCPYIPEDGSQKNGDEGGKEQTTKEVYHVVWESVDQCPSVQRQKKNK